MGKIQKFFYHGVMYRIFIICLLCSLNSATSNEVVVSPQPCSEKIPAYFFVIGEYLYWQANLSGLELSFGSSSLVQGEVNGISFTESKEFDVDPTFSWQSGFRIGGGVVFPRSNWSLNVFWTRFTDEGKKSIKGSSGIDNRGSCKVSLGQIDGIAVYECTLDAIKLEPFAGVRAAKINESIKSQVTTNITILPDTIATEVMNFDDHQYFKGIGPALGLNLNWMAAYGFGLSGEGAFSVLYGDYKVKFNDSNIFSAPLSSQSSSVIDQHLHRFNTNTDLAFNIFWKGPVYNKLAVVLNLGYELHEYHDVSNLGANKGNLSFNGAVASFEVAF